MQGFSDVCEKIAQRPVTGGHSVQNPWPFIGGVASSVVKDSDIIAPNEKSGIKEGDVLVLTKPLGTQICSLFAD